MLMCLPLLSSTEIWMVTTGVVANLFMRTMIAVRHEQPILYTLTQPFAVLLLGCIALNSAYQTTFGTIAWKGRTYQDV